MYGVLTKNMSVSSITQKEILRYMQAKDNTDEVLQAAAEGERLVLGAASCRACWTRVKVEMLSENSLRVGGIEIVSADLSKRLLGCDEAFIFAVTTGVGVDRIIRASEVSSPMLSLACDAAGSALAEELCDLLCELIDAEVKKEGRQIVKRFSAGYGDLSLEYQRDISALLNTAKNIGASLTDGVMMAPSKTVTAIVGIKE